MKKLLFLTALLTASHFSVAQSHTTQITSLANERWWGVNMSAEFSTQQTGIVMLVSSQGRYVWSQTPMTVHFSGQTITILSDGEDLSPIKAGRTMREAYLICFHKNIQSAEQVVPQDVYTKPIYDFRLDASMNHDEATVLRTADGIVAAKLPVGTIIIPAGWQSNSIVGTFNSDLYPNPGKLVADLHSKGFKVALSLSPLIPAVGRVFTDFRWTGTLLTDKSGSPIIVSKPTGYFAIIDFSNQTFTVEQWYKTYQMLKSTVGFDGYLFNCTDITPLLGNRQTDFLQYWSALGNRSSDIYEELLSDVDYPQINTPEMVAVIKAQLMSPISVVPAMAMLSLMGNAPVWQGIETALRFKSNIADYIKTLVAERNSTGEPIVRPMEYVFPNDGFADCTNQYMLGNKYLIVSHANDSQTATVRLPKGEWLDSEGKRIKGPRTISVNITDSTVLYYERK